MKKALKILSWTVGTVVALLLLAVLVLPLVFDPNQYKPQIIQAVKTHTGRDLKIDGKIGWTVFPRLGISIGRTELGNAPGFGNEPFAHVETITVRIELLPLLSKHVNVDTVVIDGLTVNLAKNAAGRTNWDDLTQTKTAAPAQKPTAEKPAAGEALAGVVINGVDIKHATLNFRDGTENANYGVRDFDLHTGRIASGTPVDLQLSLSLQYDKPVKQAQLALRSAVVLAGNSLELRNFDLKLDDSHLTGSFAITDLQKLALRFDLALDKFDLDRYLPAAAPAGADKTAAAKSAPAQPAPTPAEVPLAALRTLDADGKLRIGSLKAFGIHSSDIAIQIAAHKGVITLGPNSAKLYSGTYNGRTVINASGKTPQLAFEERLENIQLGPFLKDANVFDKFSGAANIALKLTGTGLDANQIKRTLNGTLSATVNNGAIEGIDIGKMENQITEARKGGLQQLVKALPQLTPEKGDQTKFSKLGATATVNNGVVANNDLAIEGPRLHVSGSGKINLVTDTWENYLLRVGDLPLIVSGSLSGVPTIRPDTSAITKDVVEKKKEDVKEKFEQKLKDRLKRR